MFLKETRVEGLGYTACTCEANSSVAVAHVPSKVLKIEPALFPGNRSHATVMFHGSPGCLSSLISPRKNIKKCAFEKVHYEDIMTEAVGQRQSYNNKVETYSSHCPLERQMPGDVEHTVSIHGNRGTEERDHIETLQS